MEILSLNDDETNSDGFNASFDEDQILSPLEEDSSMKEESE
jgi:hypothetical protein